METIEQKAQNVKEARQKHHEARAAFREVNRRYPGGLRPGCSDVPLDAAERREWAEARDRADATGREYDEAATELAAAYLHADETA